MSTIQLLETIQKLPIQQQFFLAEKIIQNIRKKQASHEMSHAAEELVDEYQTNKELIAFHDIDFEDFYETR